jgi:hypothetical protein
VPGERSGGYSIGHTGVIYLMGRNGEYLGFMPPQIENIWQSSCCAPIPVSGPAGADGFP